MIPLEDLPGSPFFAKLDQNRIIFLDVKIFDLAKKEVKRIIEIDPKLKLNNNILIKEELLEFHHNKSWSNIG